MNDYISQVQRLEDYLMHEKQRFDASFTRNPNLSQEEKLKAWQTFVKRMTPMVATIPAARIEDERTEAAMYVQIRREMNKRKPRCGMKATLLPLAIAYLQANPQLHNLGSKRLAVEVTDLRVGVKTWQRARNELNLPALPPGGVTRFNRTPKQERKAAFALYPNTHKIVVDTNRLKIVFHGEGGFKVAEKRTKKALAASLRLFKLAKFETREHDTETGIMILTLKPGSVGSEGSLMNRVRKVEMWVDPYPVAFAPPTDYRESAVEIIREPRPCWHVRTENRIRRAMRQLVLGDVVTIEGVLVKRVLANGVDKYIVNREPINNIDTANRPRPRSRYRRRRWLARQRGGVSVKIFFAWYDFWVGAFYDQRKQTLYICPLPMVVIRISKAA